MQTKDRKPGFSDRNPYDLSQSGLSIGAQRSEKERVCYFGNPFSKRLALVPPNPKLLERIVSILVEF